MKSCVSCCNSVNLGLVSITEKRPYDITPREIYADQLQSEAALATSEGNISISHELNIRALRQKERCPLCRCADKPQNKFLTSTLLSHTCSRAHLRKWLPPSFRHDHHTVSHYNETHMSKKVERDSYCFMTRQTGGRKCILGKF